MFDIFQAAGSNIANESATLLGLSLLLAD